MAVFNWISCRTLVLRGGEHATASAVDLFHTSRILSGESIPENWVTCLLQRVDTGGTPHVLVHTRAGPR